MLVPISILLLALLSAPTPVELSRVVSPHAGFLPGPLREVHFAATRLDPELRARLREAGGRVVAGVVDWMQASARAIDRLDPARPLLPQLPRLTDAQLREAFRSLDPLGA